jgi:hypothetical protein
MATAATGMVLVHRFYTVRSCLEFLPSRVAPVALYLACKVRETPRPLVELLKASAFVHEALTGDGSGARDLRGRGGEACFKRLRADHAELERLLLVELGFDVFVDLPHRYLLNYLRVLRLEGDRVLAQRAWVHLNDVLLTPACVVHAAETLASAAILLACRERGVPLPESDPALAWWTLFDVRQDDLADAALQLVALHSATAAG